MDNWIDSLHLKYFQESILLFSSLLPQSMFISQKKTKVTQTPPRELSIINQVRPLGE